MSEGRTNIHRRRFGSALTSLRKSAGLTGEEAAERLGLAGKSALSKIESGKQKVTGLGLTAFFAVYGVTSEATMAKVRYMATLAAPAKRTNLLDGYQDTITDAFEDYLDLEGMATSADAFFVQVIPGLLQTERYATSVVGGSGMWDSEQKVEAFVKLRLARQAALKRDESPLSLKCVIDEAALRRVVGGPAVMREQLQWLQQVTKQWEHVTIQVLPFSTGAHAAPDGSFQLLKFAMGSPVCVVETKTTSLYLEEDEHVELYGRAFADLCKQALDPTATCRYIENMIKDLET